MSAIEHRGTTSVVTRTLLGVTHTAIVDGAALADLLEVCGLDGGTPYDLSVTFAEPSAAASMLAELTRDLCGSPPLVRWLPGGGALILRRVP